MLVFGRCTSLAISTAGRYDVPFLAIGLDD